VAEADCVHKLPDNITFEQGAAINTPYGTAYHALLQRARGKRDETVLVHGASGGVGNAAVQIAIWKELVVIGTAGTPAGVDLIKRLGAQPVNHRLANRFEQILQLTNKRGVDIILEMVANVNLGEDLKLLAPGGRVAVIGSRGPVQIDARDIMSRRAEVLGVMLHSTTPQEKKQIHEDLFMGLQQGKLNPIIGKIFKLSEAPQAHKEVIEHPQGAFGKIVITPNL